MIKKNFLKYRRLAALACCVIVLAGCSCNGSQEKKKDSEKKAASAEPALKTANPETDDVTQNALSPEEEEAEVLPDSADSEEESSIRNNLAKKLPFTAGDDKICAVVYLGRGSRQQEEQLALFHKKYMPEYPLEELETSVKEGEEAYLVIPRYEQCELSLNVLERQDDGTIHVTADAEHPDGAFIVHCNPSSDFANVEINIAYRAQVHVIVPRLSPLDGQLEEMQVVLDLTDGSVYGTNDE